MASNLNWSNYERTLKNAYLQRPPTVYTVDLIAPQPGIVMFYGPPGDLKSALVLDLAFSVALGEAWLPAAKHNAGNKDIQPAKKVTQSPVIWIDFDNGVDRTDNRMEAEGQARNAPADTPLVYYSMPQPNLDASKTGQIMDLVDLIVDKKARLVVIDNLATISGGKDENSSEMMTIMQNLRLVAERTRATIIIIHHSRKENGYKGGKGDNLRGFSGIRGAIDTGLFVERIQGTDTVKIRAEKTRDISIPEFAAEFSYTHKPGCNDLETARFFGASTNNGQKGSSRQDIEDAIIDVLSALQPGQTLSQIRLANEAKKLVPDKSIPDIKQVITSMALNGIINRRTGSRNSFEFSMS